MLSLILAMALTVDDPAWISQLRDRNRKTVARIQASEDHTKQPNVGGQPNHDRVFIVTIVFENNGLWKAPLVLCPNLDQTTWWMLDAGGIMPYTGPVGTELIGSTEIAVPFPTSLFQISFYSQGPLTLEEANGQYYCPQPIYAEL